MNFHRSCGLFLIPAVILFSGCGDGNEDGEDITDSTPTDTVTIQQKINTQNILFNIPSPVETSTLLYEVGAEYDPAFTNDPLIHKSYINEEARAMNLGVYGADLSFSGIFRNTQESMNFLGAVNHLCKNLGIVGVFDEKTAERIDRNKDDRDSILEIVSSSFWEADGFLKENQRPQTSSLIVAGAWAEGMHLAGKVYEQTKSKKVKERLLSPPQKSSLESLIRLLEATRQTDEGKFLLDGLKELKAIYDKIPAGDPVTTHKTDSVTHVTTVETRYNIQVDDAVFNEILSSIESLRSKIVNTK